MRMIREDTVTPATLTSNVPVAEVEWTPGTYTLGTQRYVGTDLYEVTADPSTSDEPIAGGMKDAPTWVKIGKINRWRMFSEFIGEKTVHQSPLVVEIEVQPTTNAVALFGADAALVEVVAYSGGQEIGRASKSMTNVYEVSDWAEYYWQPVVKIAEGTILDLPSYGTDRLVITITNDNAPVSLGKMVVGEAVVLGKTGLNFRSGFDSASLKERDEFGGIKPMKRRTWRVCEFPVFIDAIKVPGVLRHLEAADATPTVYIGDPDTPESIVIGYFDAIWVARETKDLSEMTLSVWGIT